MSERPTAPNIVPFAWVARVISYELHSKDCLCYVPFATEQGRLGLDRDLSTVLLLRVESESGLNL